MRSPRSHFGSGSRSGRGRKARGWIEEVRATGDSHVAHINAADRRVVHRVAQEYEDIQTFSEGDGRDRRIIIAQKSS